MTFQKEIRQIECKVNQFTYDTINVPVGKDEDSHDY